MHAAFHRIVPLRGKYANNTARTRSSRKGDVERKIERKQWSMRNVTEGNRNDKHPSGGNPAERKEGNMALERLRMLREEYEWTQREVAKVLHVSQTAVSDYERKKLDIPVINLRRLALFYDTSVDDLAGLTDERAPHPRSGPDRGRENQSFGTGRSKGTVAGCQTPRACRGV